jgi:hypothetical protein
MGASAFPHGDVCDRPGRARDEKWLAIIEAGDDGGALAERIIACPQCRRIAVKAASHWIELAGDSEGAASLFRHHMEARPFIETARAARCAAR